MAAHVPTRMMKIHSKTVLKWSHHYALILRSSIATNCAVSELILPKFELIQAFMIVLVTYKNEEDPCKNEVPRVVTTLLQLLVYGDFSKRIRLG